MTNDKKLRTHEALWWERSSKGVRCELCPHGCDLGEGQRGLCGSRINQDGVMCSEAYGNLCALNIDPVEKKPLLHYHPGIQVLSLASAGCNFACRNCQNAEISQAKPSEVRSEYYEPEKIVAIAKQTHCPAIAYTYTEPLTWYEYVYDTAALAREEHIGNILVSAGFINEKPLTQLCGVIDAANIDLKSFSDDLYRKINRGRLEPVLRTLKIMKEAGVWLEITNLLIPTVNDSEEMLRQMCDWLAENGFCDTPLHFSRFFPMYRMEEIPVTPLATIEKAAAIAHSAGIRYVYLGNVSETEGENTLCPHCGKRLVHRRGYDILSNGIRDGKCPSCGTPIAGQWSMNQ